jgi:uncharacterized membrane protein YagU involved in acid resistance
MKTAGKLAAMLLGKQLSREQKKKLGPVIHYGFGSLVGALYGGLAELAPVAREGLGIPFGTVVFLAADEIAVPALGLSKAPTAYPLSSHASAFASHAVYGLTTELVRRRTRHFL